MTTSNNEAESEIVMQEAISGMIGKACCRQRVGRMHSLSIGFGERIFHGKSNLPDTFYGEWEIGTYSTAWRVIQNVKILCGSQDTDESISDLDERLNTIGLGRIIAVHAISRFDIRIAFDGDTIIDFLGSISDDDEIFHIFGPNNLYIEYSVCDGWKVGKSNEPWR